MPPSLEDEEVQHPAPLADFPATEVEAEGDEKEEEEEEVESSPLAFTDKGKSIVPLDDDQWSDEEYDYYDDDEVIVAEGADDYQQEIIGALSHIGFSAAMPVATVDIAGGSGIGNETEVATDENRILHIFRPIFI